MCCVFVQADKGLLQIGNHRVTGQLETLPKPLLLIDREDRGSSGPPASSSSSVSASDASDLHGGSYRIKAVVRKRLRFEDMPQPIIGAAGAGGGGKKAAAAVL